ncbi:ribonucleoside-triphosphate reductase [Candidatus Magnetomorum sp. HK-1]|nr:ribonucleoside-triphosphate reductase [Candidatus Magnetomorum sp. HK-1]
MICHIYATLARTRTLGPYLRYALWVQGCLQYCPGCMTPDAQPSSGGQDIPIDVLAQEILSDDKTEGLTISGGEPFLQARALHSLVRLVRLSRPMGVIVYTGYLLETIQQWPDENNRKDIMAFLSQIDLLIDGPYVQALNDGMFLRGSSNQRFHFLSCRYQNAIDLNSNDREVELHMQADSVFLSGIPGTNMLQKWQSRFNNHNEVKKR